MISNRRAAIELTVIASTVEEAEEKMKEEVERYKKEGANYIANYQDRKITVGSSVRYFRTVKETLERYIPEDYWEDT